VVVLLTRVVDLEGLLVGSHDLLAEQLAGRASQAHGEPSSPRDFHGRPKSRGRSYAVDACASMARPEERDSHCADRPPPTSARSWGGGLRCAGFPHELECVGAYLRAGRGAVWWRRHPRLACRVVALNGGTG